LKRSDWTRQASTRPVSLGTTNLRAIGWAAARRDKRRRERLWRLWLSVVLFLLGLLSTVAALALYRPLVP